MAEITWSQDVFSKGELSPFMYSRVMADVYYKALLTAKNVITYPQGAAGKRFGTIYLNEITGVTDYTQINFKSFDYLAECVYLIVMIPDNILIYLEGVLIATVASSGIAADIIQSIDTTILDTAFRVSSQFFAPHDLIRTNNANNAITGFTSSTFTLTNALQNGAILPVRFTWAAQPTTSPQIRTGKTYFFKMTSTTTAEVYSSSTDAADGINKYVISSAGTTAIALVANTWNFLSLTNASYTGHIRNYPIFDFGTVDYDAFSFTLGATSGFGVSLSSDTAIFTSDYIGGAFVGNGGIARITAVANSTTATVNILQTFDATTMPGSTVVVAEKAWSDNRGWPAKCSSFQSRAVFANSDQLPNGLWLSVVNDYSDFNDLENDADSAISWYPTSDTVNYIRFIVPYRSLTIHTNSGIYSTPLSYDTNAITPTNFSITLQDSTPATSIQPRGIDNQIIIISGNDVHSMLWDGLNNSYSSSIASISNEQLIRTPIDETAYIDFDKAGSRYMFIINSDGTMAIFQTLVSEDVQGFTPAVFEQSYGNAYFRWGASSLTGRAWFVVERQIATEGSTIAITGSSATTFTATASNFSTTTPIAVQFTTTGILPLTNPQIALSTYYWALGVDANTFTVYLSQADALAGENAISITNYGTNSSVVAWPLSTRFFIEELSFDVFVDCATVYSGTATSTVSGQGRFNAQSIVMQGDGFGFSEDSVVGGNVDFEAHGVATNVSNAFIGFPINLKISPLQVAPPGSGGQKGSTLPFAQHIRVASFAFTETIGGEINGTPITFKTLEQTVPGSPPTPQTGFFQVAIMGGWNDILTPQITITHSEPFDIKLTGIFYKIDQ